MLTRVYLENFRCFENFEYRPTRKQVILGPNGAGKSSLLDAVLFIRQVLIDALPLDDFGIPTQRTRWRSNRSTQTLELEAVLGGDKYIYRIVLEPWGDPVRTKIGAERLSLNGSPIFGFSDGEVHLYNDRLEHKVTYPFDWHRSALATIMSRKDNQKLTRFKSWLSSVLCFRINPFAISARSEVEQTHPTVQLDNLASWYRHLVQVYPAQNFALTESLAKSIEGFSYLKLDPAGENVRLLTAEFTASGRQRPVRVDPRQPQTAGPLCTVTRSRHSGTEAP